MIDHITSIQPNKRHVFNSIPGGCSLSPCVNLFSKDQNNIVVSEPESAPSDANGGGCGSGEALDLIKGHLTEYSYEKASRGLPAEIDLKNWFKPSLFSISQDASYYVLKVQRFKAGGYEMVCGEMDLQKIIYSMDSPRKTGKREKTEQNENDVISSQQRAKRKVRHLIKSIGCDRMLTLTKREVEGSVFWTISDWKNAWDKFNRLVRKAGLCIEYVAVLEQHKKGNYHLHAAIVGRLNVNLIRNIWLSCVGAGKGSGNVDIRYRPDCTDLKRREGLAKYVSKYITKQFGNVEFNKKRYWASKHKLPAAERYILKAKTVYQALDEICEQFGLQPYWSDGKGGTEGGVYNNAFVFPDRKGFFLNFTESLCAPPDF